MSLSNSMVAHVWAQQTRRNGKSSNGNVYFEGPTLYSYGGHFPVGIFAQDGTVFLNSDSYSVSTSRHQSEARSAVRHRTCHYLPELGDIGDMIRQADSRGRIAHNAANPRDKRVLSYLAKNWQRLDAESEGAAWLLRAIGSRATWPAMRARYAAKADAKARQSKARLRAQNITAARHFAAIPWAVLRARAWGEADSYGQRNLASTIQDMRESRLATPKAHKRIRSALWQYETRLRAIMARAKADADRHGNPGNRTKARALIGKLRRLKTGNVGHVPGYAGPDGPDKLQAALALPTGAAWRMLADTLAELARLPLHMPPAMRAAGAELQAKAHETATQREGEESARAAVRNARSYVLNGLRAFNLGRRHLRALEAEGPHCDRQRRQTLNRLREGCPVPTWGTATGFAHAPALAERAARIAARAAEMVPDFESRYLELCTDFERRAAELRAAAEAEAARIAAMSPAELRDAWHNGELGRGDVARLERESGPLLRAIGAEVNGCTVTGGTLETSQGASVPLRHAFRVFQFVALCRAEGKAWKAGGAWGPRAIRVGHFTVDSVAASGDFVAGCHSIRWPEVAELAARLGVADCLATLPEIKAELQAESV